MSKTKKKKEKERKRKNQRPGSSVTNRFSFRFLLSSLGVSLFFLFSPAVRWRCVRRNALFE